MTARIFQLILPCVADGTLLFLGDFSGDKGDRFIEETLWREREGILYQLVQDCADVKRNGLRPPLAVTQATAELMDENDLTAQFISDCVMKSDTFTSKQNVEAAIRHWLPGMVVGADKRVDRIIADLKMKFEWGKRRRRETSLGFYWAGAREEWLLGVPLFQCSSLLHRLPYY